MTVLQLALVVLVINIPTGIFLIQWMFPGKDQFTRAWAYALTPDFASFLRGEWGRDVTESMKLWWIQFFWISILVAEFILILSVNRFLKLDWIIDQPLNFNYSIYDFLSAIF